MTINFKDWKVWAGLVGAIVAAVLGYFGISGCAQSVPVIVQQQHYQCSNVIEGSDGLQFTGCQHSGNHQGSGVGDTKQDADGQVDLPVNLDIKPKGEPSSSRYSLPPQRYANLLN